MKLGAWMSEGKFSTKLLALAVSPVLLTWLLVNVSMHVLSKAEVERELEDRAAVFASAAAEGVRYGLVVGSVAEVHRALRGLLKVEPAVVRITIRDESGQDVARLDGAPAIGPIHRVQRPVESAGLDIDLLDGRGPQIASPGGQPTRALGAVRRVGDVVVDVSAARLLEVKRKRLVAAGAAVSLVAAISAMVALAWARKLRGPLVDLLDALHRVRGASYDIQFARKGPGEIGALQEAVQQMAQRLGDQQRHLEAQVSERTAALQEALELLGKAADEKGRLIARSNRLLEEERRRISAEIHDELNAMLVGMRLEADVLAASMPADADPEAANRARRLVTMIEEAYRQARDIVKSLRPEAIDALGLMGAIEGLVRQYDQLHPRCHFTLTADGDFDQLSGSAAMAVYRVTQEALTNVAKHAGATRCGVTLRWVVASDMVELCVEDDGSGFDPANVGHDRLGLVGMRERVAAFGGSLAVQSEACRGTKVTVTMPAGTVAFGPGASTST